MDTALGHLSVQGPLAAAAVDATLGAGTCAPLDRAFASAEIEFQGATIHVIRQSRTGEDGYDLLAPTEALEPLWTALTQRARPAGLAALDLARIEAAIPWAGRELDDRIIPLEARLEHAICLTKGCFNGYETLAKMTYRGKPARLLRALRLDPGGAKLPEPGAELTVGGRTVGWIGSATVSPKAHGPVALAMIKSKLADTGATFEVQSPDGHPGTAVVIDTPIHWGTGPAFPPLEA
jgi:folate-binding protein YgfZ